jgi:hypothetical protein
VTLYNAMSSSWCLQAAMARIGPARSPVCRCKCRRQAANLRIHTWLALRPCRREHLGVMDRGRAAWDKDKPRTLGHRGNSFRCRWIDLAAVSAEEGPCRRPPGVGGTGSDYAGRWGTDGVGFLRWSTIRTGSARSISVYRPHTPICCDLSRCRAWRGLHRC